MLLIDCPYCGKRPEIEFTHGGQAHLARPGRPADIDDAAWADFLYMRTNTKGIHAERWRHAHGCGRFFNALRDTTTDRFLAFYRTGEPRPKLSATVGEPRPELSATVGEPRPELSATVGERRSEVSATAGERRSDLPAAVGKTRPELPAALGHTPSPGTV